MKFTLAQIAGAAGIGGLNVDDVMHDLLILGTHNGGTPTLREYMIAHAPTPPAEWFAHRSADEMIARHMEWPGYWADEQLRILTEKRRDEARKR